MLLCYLSWEKLGRDDANVVTKSAFMALKVINSKEFRKWSHVFVFLIIETGH